MCLLFVPERRSESRKLFSVGILGGWVGWLEMLMLYAAPPSTSPTRTKGREAMLENTADIGTVLSPGVAGALAPRLCPTLLTTVPPPLPFPCAYT